MSVLVSALAAAFGVERVKVDASLAPLTTFKVGGPADVLFEPADSDELLRADIQQRSCGPDRLTIESKVSGKAVPTRHAPISPPLLV